MSDAASQSPGWRRDWVRLAGAAVVAQLLPLAVLPWLTRVFDAVEIGRWTFFMALASNMAVVACLRFEYAIVLPRRAVVARLLLCLCVALAWGWGALLGLVWGLAWLLDALFGGPFRGAVPDATLLCLPAAAGLAGTVQALTLWHNRIGKFGPVGQARVAAPGVTAGLQALAGACRCWGGAALVGAQVAGQGVAAAWLGWSARASLRGGVAAQAGRPRPMRVRRWLRLAGRLVRRYRQFPLVNAPHAFVNGLQDTLALALVLMAAGSAAAGFFGLMVRVVMAPTSLIGGALSEVLLGRAAATWREGGDLRPLIGRAVRLLALFAVPSAVVLALLGPWLFEALFGAAWREAGEWARWLAPCMAGRMIVGPLTVLPMIFQRQPTAFAFSVCGNALYVLALGLGLLAVPDWGGESALRLGCGLVSVAMSAYFAVYLAWLWRLAAPRVGQVGGTR